LVGGDWHRAPEISGPVRTSSRPARSEPGRKNHGPAAAQRSFVSRDLRTSSGARHDRCAIFPKQCQASTFPSAASPTMERTRGLRCWSWIALILPLKVGGRRALSYLRDQAHAPAVFGRSGAGRSGAHGAATSNERRPTGLWAACTYRLIQGDGPRPVLSGFLGVRNDNNGKSPACLAERRTISAAPRRRCGRRRPPPVRCLVQLLFSLSPWSATPSKLGRIHCCRVVPPCRISIRSTTTTRSRGHRAINSRQP
jgi:hypothetical protein